MSLNQTDNNFGINSSRWESERNIQELLSKNNKITIWTEDDISPASFMQSYKKNIMLQWSPQSTTRMVSTGEAIEVLVHQDETVLLIRDGGRFINHYRNNSSLVPTLRSFTCDTIPFSVSDNTDPVNNPRVQLQEILSDAFIILKHPYEPNPLYAAVNSEDNDDPLSKANLMAAQDNLLVKEMKVEGLAHFMAYSNKSIKVSFSDRTLLRMMHNCPIIRILNKLGEEISLNVVKPNILYNDYKNYIKVADEFYEWAFSTQEERQAKELEQQRQREIIEYEMQRIQRTLCYIDENKYVDQFGIKDINHASADNQIVSTTNNNMLE